MWCTPGLRGVKMASRKTGNSSGRATKSSADVSTHNTREPRW